MALIGQIRNNSWLLVVMIALGLGGFIFMDMFSGQQSVFGSGATEMMNIDGRSIDINEFNRTESILYGNSAGDPYSRRQTLYNNYVDEVLVGNEAEAIGLGVGEAELEDLIFGNNPSPIITSSFANPQTGQINREALNSYKDENRPEQFDAQWNLLKEQVRTDRLKTKINNLVEKGIYTPTWLAEMSAADKGNYRKVAVVKVPYEAIENTDVALSDADYMAYLNDNKTKYMSTEETRRINYVVFPVEATEEDKANLRKELAESAAGFSAADDNEAYVNANYGTYTPRWFDKATLPADIADTITTMSQGAVYGPYLEGNNYKLAKIVQKQAMQDSAKCRHILISAQTPAEFEVAQARADSIMNVIRTTNTSWDTLALRHSEDPGSKNKGGFYDYAPVNQYVPEFNDAVFFDTPVGSLTAVKTQFGIHVIEPLGRKGASKTYYRMAYVSEAIVPSEDTQNNVENEAIDFIDNNTTAAAMATAAAEKGLDVQTSQSLKANDYFLGTLGGGQTSRDIIRWAFGNAINVDAGEVGDVSPELYSYNNEVNFYTDKYVAVALKSVQAPGMPILANIKDELELPVMNAKKAEAIKAKIAGNTDLNAIAGQFEEVSVDTVAGATFGGSSLTNFGIEPAVQGAIFNTPANTVSAPVAGNSGVFVVKTIEETANQNRQTVAQKKSSAATAIVSQVKNKIITSLRKNADIEDNRARFF